MSQDKETFVQDTLNFVAVAKRKGNRVAFWGWDADVVGRLEQLGMLEGMETIFVSDEFPVQDISICKYSQNYFDADELFQDAGKIREFKPDKVCILHADPYRAVSSYEVVIREYGIEPMNVYGTSRMWTLPDYDDSLVFKKLSARVPKHIPGGLIPKALKGVYNGLRYVIENNVPGRIVNYGISRGWSMYFIALALNHFGDEEREIVGFDGFKGFPQCASPLDLCNLKYQKITSTRTPKTIARALDETKANLAPHMHRTTIIPGDVFETISQLGSEPVALALFDMDDYTPTKDALGPTYDCLSQNGIFVMDHFTYDSIGGFCIGQRIAMLEFMEEHPMLDFPETHMFIKTRA